MGRVAGRSAARRRAPANSPYNWASYDSAVSAARAHGLRVELSLSGPAPAWATGNRRFGPMQPNATKFGQFATAVAQHFKGKVDRYAIWNEPNYPSWLAPQSTAPQQYRKLYTAAYKAIKAVDVQDQVLIGETVPFAATPKATAPLAFLRGVFCNGCAPLQADGFAHHPYDFDHAPNYRYPGPDNVTIGTLGRLTSYLDDLGRRKLLTTPDGTPMPLYLTEFGYFASGKRAFPVAKRSKYLVQAFQIAARNPRVRELVQYLLVEPPPKFPFNTGLVTPAGSTLAPFTGLASWAQTAIKAGRAASPSTSPKPPTTTTPTTTTPTTTTPTTTTPTSTTPTTTTAPPSGTGGASPG